MVVDTGAEPMDRRRVLESLSGLLLALFVALIGSTVVSVALPRIIGSLNGTQTQYTWVVTATLLTATATTPVWGKLADLFNKKTLVQAAIVIFVVGSMLSGFAQDTSQLIAARAFQGIGIGGLQALAQVVMAAIIPPRERGRYYGYLGAVTASATVGGPLLGGLIVDVSWLGWRWCFFFAVPIAVIAFVVLQRTLKLPTVRRDDVQVDYLGASLIAIGVSVLLIWVSFVGNSFDWLSWETAAMVGGGLVVLGLALLVESRVREPIVPLKLVVKRTPALAILASLAVGMAMYGGAVFLGQYFQIGRGFTPTEAGLLTIPMMGGVLGSSMVAGRLISRTGVVKPFIVTGAVVLVLGFLGLGMIDHATSLWLVGIAMAAVGIGVGMTMQNLVLTVQNTVSLRDLGAASASVTFFRSLGGTIGVSVLGAVLANRVTADLATALNARAGSATAQLPGEVSALNLQALPAAVRQVVQTVYGDATAHIFLISAAVGVVGIVAALLLKPITLRTTIDVESEEPAVSDPVAG
jgi:EmrB/QacA subfamily drug resistance transporter